MLGTGQRSQRLVDRTVARLAPTLLIHVCVLQVASLSATPEISYVTFRHFFGVFWRLINHFLNLKLVKGAKRHQKALHKCRRKNFWDLLIRDRRASLKLAKTINAT